jgi:hypothetical protein
MFFIDPDGNYIEIYYGKDSKEHKRYEYQKDRNYSEIESPFLADAYRALDALYTASNIEIDGKEVNIMDTLMKSDKELSVVHTDQGSSFAPARDFESKDKWKNGVSSVIGTIYFNNKEGVLFDSTRDANEQTLRNEFSTKKLPKTANVNSPTSLLGHEIGHAYGWNNDPNAYQARKIDRTTRMNTPYFTNGEEKNATTLSMQININLGEKPRPNYRAIGVQTQGVLSNKIKKL